MAPLPSIGIIPSSPDDTKTSVAGLSVGAQQSSVIQDHRAESSGLKNDSQVCGAC